MFKSVFIHKINKKKYKQKILPEDRPFLHGLQAALGKVFINKDIPEWTLIVPSKNSRIYNARGLMKGLEKVPEDTDVVCLLGTRYYDIAKAKEHEILLRTPKGKVL